MYCPNCGRENVDKALFCEYCGEDLREVNAQDIDEPVEPAGEPEDFYDDTAAYSDFPQDDFSNDSYYEQTYPVKRNKIPALAVSLILEGIVLAILLVMVFLNIGQTKSPRLAAEKTFIALANRDVETAYHQFLLEEGPFTDLESFRKALSERGIGQVTSYRLESAEEMSAKEDQENSADEEAERVSIYYTSKNSAFEQEEDLKMVKDPSASFLENPWKWEPDILLVEDLTLLLPQGETASLDGKDLATYAAGKEEDHDRYVIPQVFSGIHTLEVEKKNGQRQTIDYYVDRQNDVIRLDRNPLAEEGNRAAILKTIEEDSQKIVKAIMERKPFSAIESLFVADRRDYVKDHYETYLKRTEESPAIQSYEIKEMKAQFGLSDEEVYLSIDGILNCYDLTEDNRVEVKPVPFMTRTEIRLREEDGVYKHEELESFLPLNYQQ